MLGGNRSLERVSILSRDRGCPGETAHPTPWLVALLQKSETNLPCYLEGKRKLRHWFVKLKWSTFKTKFENPDFDEFGKLYITWAQPKPCEFSHCCRGLQNPVFCLRNLSIQDDATLGNSGLQEPAGVLRSSSVCSLCLADLRLVRIVIGGIC